MYLQLLDDRRVRTAQVTVRGVDNSTLPHDILSYLLPFLDGGAVGCMVRVCRAWYHSMERELCYVAGYGAVQCPSAMITQLYPPNLREVSFNKRHFPPSPPPDSPQSRYGFLGNCTNLTNETLTYFLMHYGASLDVLDINARSIRPERLQSYLQSRDPNTFSLGLWNIGSELVLSYQDFAPYLTAAHFASFVIEHGPRYEFSATLEKVLVYQNEHTETGRLRVLVMNRNSVNLTTACKYLPGCHQLDVLDLSHTNIYDDAMKHLWAPYLQVLRLKSIGIGNNKERAKGISQALSHCKYLKSLNLQSNSIDGVAMAELADGLSRLVNLTELNMGHNYLTKAAAESLAAVMMTLQRLQIINLSHCVFSLNSVNMFCPVITQNRELKQFDLSHNTPADRDCNVEEFCQCIGTRGKGNNRIMLGWKYELSAKVLAPISRLEAAGCIMKSL
eukprot:PhF_6_TR11019/c0_g1_i1/m.17845